MEEGGYTGTRAGMSGAIRLRNGSLWTGVGVGDHCCTVQPPPPPGGGTPHWPQPHGVAQWHWGMDSHLPRGGGHLYSEPPPHQPPPLRLYHREELQSGDPPMLQQFQRLQSLILCVARRPRGPTATPARPTSLGRADCSPPHARSHRF